MNVPALQLADRWIGVPLCWSLTLLRRCTPAWSPRSATAPERLAFIKLAEQGSTVLAYAALRRAVEMVGRENVYFVAFANNRFILDALEVIPRENVVTVPVNGLVPFITGMLRAIGQLRRLRLASAVDMEFFSRGSAALTFASGARRRVGFHAYFGDGPYRGNLMTHRLLYNPHLHTSQTFLSLVEALRCEPEALPTYNLVPTASPEHPPQITTTAEERATVEQLVYGDREDRPPIILLNPNASDLVPLRRWPVERYVELARRLLQAHPEALVAMTGGPDEASAAAVLVGRVGSPRCVSLAGKTTLRQLLVLYTIAEVLVTNDSGPAHFATLTPIEVVTLFGPETPRLFAARTPRNTVLWAGLVCSPCVSAFNNRMSPCRDNRCMQAITVDQVFSAASRAYERKQAERNSATAGSIPAFA